MSREENKITEDPNSWNFIEEYEEFVEKEIKRYNSTQPR